MSPSFLACVSLLCLGMFLVPRPLQAEQRRIAVTWNVLDNDTNSSPSLFSSELVLANHGAQPLGNQGWQLYFNFCRKIIPESVSGSVRIVHVNGDLFRLEPKSSFASLRPGTDRIIRFQTNYCVIKESDAPSGFYLVEDEIAGENRVIESLGDAAVGPIKPPLQTMRARDDQVGVPTPQTRYEENQELNQGDQTPQGIVPTPLLLNSGSGDVTIDRQTTVVYESSVRAEAAYLSATLEPLLGTRLVMQDSEADTANRIALSIRDLSIDGETKTAGDNAYRMSIQPGKGVTIIGSDPAGVFYGIQSLRAWLPIIAFKQPRERISLGAVEIEDAPRFAYRGLHLDVARNFQTVTSVKKLLDLMAFYKLNKFHFHLTDDEGWRLDIVDLPELTKVGGRRSHSEDGSDTLPPSFGSGPDGDSDESFGTGYYSREEFVGILRYAAERHIEVIPEIDLPGHARAAIKAMELRRKRLLAEGREEEANEYLLSDPDDRSEYESVQMWNDNVINVCQDSAYTFVRHVLYDIRRMYTEANLTLETVHLGGDEVPDGVWDDSPQCRNEYSASNVAHESIGKGAMADFFKRVAGTFSEKAPVVTGAWEEVFLDELRNPRIAREEARGSFFGKGFRCYVWNNVWGWGQEDAAYRLANAGVDVVLCNATHLYFDLAYNKDPREPGYYWAGFIDTKTAYSFAPMNYLSRTQKDIFGNDIAWENIQRRVRLSEEGKNHILGIQGQLWGENLKGRERLEYMALPRLIALAERAWSKEPAWITDESLNTWPRKLQQSWADFAKQLGCVELPRLDCLHGGFNYRIPDAGAVIEDGVLKANVAFDGLTIRYTTDNSEPDVNSNVYSEPVEVGSTARVRVFTSTGRGGRSCTVHQKNSHLN